MEKKEPSVDNSPNGRGVSLADRLNIIFRGLNPSATGKEPESLSRRKFLKNAAIATVAVGSAPLIHVAFDPEFRAGVAAAGARAEMSGEGERYEVSRLVLLRVYKKHFGDKVHLFPESAWVRSEATQEGEKLRGNGVHLGILAQGCYEAEKKGDEDFNSYYVRFVDSLNQLSELAGMDFITLVASLQISAENIAGFEEPKDSSSTDNTVSMVQGTIITASRAVGLESAIISSLGPGALASQVRTAAEARGISTPLDAAIPREGIRHYDLIRFREQPTTGLMDVEPGVRAEACRELSGNELVAILRREFPQVYEAYARANEKRDAVTTTREDMRFAAHKYIEKYTNRLTKIAYGDISALEAIGIAPTMGSYQLQNYTDAWYITSQIPTNPEFAYQRTVEHMRTEIQKNPQDFYRRLFSQQIRNPKFLLYLTRQAAVSGNKEEVLQACKLIDLVEQYEQRAKELRIAHNQVLEAEGPYEYSSRFQQLTSILTTKSLSDAAGDFDSENRDSLGWHLYKTCAVREIAPIPFLVDGDPFAADITIDPPYAQKSVSESLDKFAEMMESAGIISSSPASNVRKFYQETEKMFWRDGGVWFGPEPSPEDAAKWNELLEHFNTKLANRLFYDFTGILRDEQRIAELSTIMLDCGLITQSVQMDPYNFFTQFVYVSLNSSHMRRDVSSENWEKVQSYFRENILPMVITRKETSPGVFSDKWNIGSADYPPLFRSQAVMYNYLYDGSQTPPASNFSSEVVGHH